MQLSLPAVRKLLDDFRATLSLCVNFAFAKRRPIRSLSDSMQLGGGKAGVEGR